jgi:hypothetical protein
VHVVGRLKGECGLLCPLFPVVPAHQGRFERIATSTVRKKYKKIPQKKYLQKNFNRYCTGKFSFSTKERKPQRFCP